MQIDTRNIFETLERNIKLAEYLLVVSPDKKSRSELVNYQAQLAGHFESGVEILPLRHILLLTFMAKESIEETISRWISKICKMHVSFDLDFEEYCNYQQAVLFLKVKTGDNLAYFNTSFRVMDDFLRASDCLPTQIVAEPQLPLAIIHKPARSWAEKKAFLPAFTGCIHAGEIMMLKRTEPGDPFERINIFGLATH